MTKRLEAVPEVSYIELVLCSFDISVTLNCTDNDHLLAVLGDDIRSTPGVEVVEAWTVLKMTKDIYHGSSRVASRSWLIGTNSGISRASGCGYRMSCGCSEGIAGPRLELPGSHP